MAHDNLHAALLCCSIWSVRRSCSLAVAHLLSTRLMTAAYHFGWHRGWDMSMTLLRSPFWKLPTNHWIRDSRPHLNQSSAAGARRAAMYDSACILVLTKHTDERHDCNSPRSISALMYAILLIVEAFSAFAACAVWRYCCTP